MSSEPPHNYSEDNYFPQTDADLFMRLRDGETDALAVLYDRHASLVYGLSLKLLRNRAEAEDLTQDIFLTLVKKSNYDPQRGTLRTYLAILTKSRALDRLRKSTKHQQIKERASKESAEARLLDPLEEALQAERAQEVKSALQQLSNNEREVLNMAYYQGLSQSEIAKRLNIALGTIKSRTRRSLIKLRQALTNHSGRS